jgi:hypothetical protein
MYPLWCWDTNVGGPVVCSRHFIGKLMNGIISRLPQRGSSDHLPFHDHQPKIMWGHALGNSIDIALWC